MDIRYVYLILTKSYTGHVLRVDDTMEGSYYYYIPELSMHRLGILVTDTECWIQTQVKESGHIGHL